MPAYAATEVGSVADTTLPEEDGDNPDGANSTCSCCAVQLGKRFLRPRHLCKICNRVCCAACSPSSVQLSDQRHPQRACRRCIAAAEGAPAFRTRLAALVGRLHNLSQSSSATSRGVSGPLAPENLEEAMSLCEVAVSAAEEARDSMRLRADQAEAVALMERQIREQIEAKALAARESVTLLGGQLRDAHAACEAVVAPLSEIDHRHPGMEAWARDRAGEEARLADERRARLEVEAELGTVRECFLRLGARLHDLAGAKRPQSVPAPTSESGLEELIAFCDAALPSLKEALANGSERAAATGDGRIEDALAAVDDLPASLPRARSSITGMEDQCSSCGTMLGRRHLHRKHSCGLCSSSVCSNCSVQPRACKACLEGAQMLPATHERVARLSEQMRSITGKSKAIRAEPGTLQEALALCEAALQPLRDLRAGQDVARALAEEARKHLEANAQAAMEANADLGSRLAALVGGQPTSAKAPAKPAKPPAKVSGSPGGTATANPANPSFWATIPERIVSEV